MFIPRSQSQDKLNKKYLPVNIQKMPKEKEKMTGNY